MFHFIVPSLIWLTYRITHISLAVSSWLAYLFNGANLRHALCFAPNVVAMASAGGEHQAWADFCHALPRVTLGTSREDIQVWEEEGQEGGCPVGMRKLTTGPGRYTCPIGSQGGEAPGVRRQAPFFT